jgi:uncharacterized protein (TIGR02246 family)
MKKNLALFLMGILSLGCAALAQAQAPGATEKAVAALEEKWAQAQRTHNVDTEASLMAEKYVSTGVDGNVSNRTQSIAEEKATKYSSVEIVGIQVTAFGDTAIASVEMKAKGTDPKGKPFDSHSRWTDTWVKMTGGEWQCVASHGSNVKM